MALRPRAEGSFFRSVEPESPSARGPRSGARAAAPPGLSRDRMRPRIGVVLWFAAVAAAAALLAVFAS